MGRNVLLKYHDIVKVELLLAIDFDLAEVGILHQIGELVLGIESILVVCAAAGDLAAHNIYHMKKEIIWAISLKMRPI